MTRWDIDHPQFAKTSLCFWCLLFWCSVAKITPNAGDFASCLKKFKCAFNILVRLLWLAARGPTPPATPSAPQSPSRCVSPRQVEVDGQIDNPTSTEFIHMLFTTLGFVSDHGPCLWPGVATSPRPPRSPDGSFRTAGGRPLPRRSAADHRDSAADTWVCGHDEQGCDGRGVQAVAVPGRRLEHPQVGVGRTYPFTHISFYSTGLLSTQFTFSKFFKIHIVHCSGADNMQITGKLFTEGCKHKNCQTNWALLYLENHRASDLGEY